MNSYSTTGSLHLKPKPNPSKREELSASISTLFYINLHLRPPLRGFTLIWGSLYSVVLRLSAWYDGDLHSTPQTRYMIVVQI
ncbi:hypothetical protein SDJN02_17058, partial [Cucurbita argyrosperma subsp. argyrosperma]